MNIGEPRVRGKMKQTAGASLNTIPYQALIAYVCVFSIFICLFIQCGQSSRSQDGRSNLDSTVDDCFQKTLNPWRERSHVCTPKTLKVSYDHFCGWLETSNHPLFWKTSSRVESRFLPPTWERLDWPHCKCWENQVDSRWLLECISLGCILFVFVVYLYFYCCCICISIEKMQQTADTLLNALPNQT